MLSRTSSSKVLKALSRMFRHLGDRHDGVAMDAPRGTAWVAYPAYAIYRLDQWLITDAIHRDSLNRIDRRQERRAVVVNVYWVLYQCL
jgi:hypothetical protein